MKNNFQKNIMIGLLGISAMGIASAFTKPTDLVSADVNSDDENQMSQAAPLTANGLIGPGFYDSSDSSAIGKAIKPNLPSSFSSRAISPTQLFIDQVASGAISGWNKYGVLPSVSIAQSILESGWGKSDLSTVANNLFGIKGSYLGQSIIMPTQEYVNGSWITVNAQFRKYPDWNASIEDHGNFLYSNSRYSSLLGVTEYQKVTQILQNAGYATAPNYAQVLNQIIEQYNLVQYDQSTIPAHFGSLNNLSFDKSNDTVNTRGWHIDNASAAYPYSFIVLTDVDSGKQYSQIPISRIAREDVVQFYPDVTNALNSGFQVNIPATKEMEGHTYRVTSRYAQQSNGAGNVLDYDFDATVKVPKLGNENQANLDSFTIKNSKLYAKGWHAADQAEGKNYHYLIAMNANTNQEIKRIKVNNVARPDVNNVVPNIYNSLNSGFDASMGIDPTMWDKNIYLISRYTSDPAGNGNYVDYAFTKSQVIVPQSTENVAGLNNFAINRNSVDIRGWHASDLSYGRDYHYLIAMDAKTGKELKRIRSTNVSRPDVNKFYPDIYNSLNSGFETSMVIDPSMWNKDIYLISRYSKTLAGNSDYVDFSFGTKSKITVPQPTENKADINSIVQENSTVTIRGWHASDLSYEREYRYLFVMDKKTNKELKRVKINSVARPDVVNFYPNLYGASNSGFSVNISTNGLSGREVYIISRYSGNISGNSNYVDYAFYDKVFTIR
ncbi:glycoside hydrolase family 73 protein [Lapidilactobacillus wuchangensis]|uniref:glycoside hydrolase family 73 protein n=1 Tax=Lapidilactobacillus wuchangensis TaxID=2486001 RepID=UPI000F7B143D|nr:glycoside hydrolase family 73 protein [Lapidilactobacillus wuchangensis]